MTSDARNLFLLPPMLLLLRQTRGTHTRMLMCVTLNCARFSTANWLLNITQPIHSTLNSALELKCRTERKRERVTNLSTQDEESQQCFIFYHIYLYMIFFQFSLTLLTRARDMKGASKRGREISSVNHTAPVSTLNSSTRHLTFVVTRK